MNGREKATLLLSMLGPQLSTTVLRRLPEHHAKKLASTINNLPPPDPKIMPDFFREIVAFVEDQSRSESTLDQVKEDAMQQLAAEPTPAPLPKPENIRSLRDLSPVMVWEVLAKEKPQIIAFFLQNLSEDLREPLVSIAPPGKLPDLQQRPVFDHELSKQIFQQLADYMIQFWKAKLSPEPSASPLFAS